ncbi:hypothetical protein A2935_03240 [Candidatus Wolfebacteria bacterium RIFCSPLOWO2_01_FULL_47_17b]|uniref:Ribonuclease VapC n=1 Tax=Candidatus Wolfebacteria bacterium RIFCSPLOWO2_01_FULL_47_17b TaxID=1802558 RepID=A0A1F8DZS0_9BACT|nr:MAG: hypothetical protein A2935_03240 [Candidatus Wolfebacteria bacterium RIFCSPLOWO2_01_FULL_47_17b]
MYTLDTNAIIYYFKGDEDSVRILNEIFSENLPLYVSALTETELFSFSHLTPRDAERIEGLIRTVAVIPVDSRIARIAGLLRRKYRLAIADSVIAATALFTGTTLLTRNIRDFKRIPNLLLQKI